MMRQFPPVSYTHLSKVVKVEGKVINRKAHAIADLVVPVSYTHLDVYKRQAMFL